jgi:hypothetical protein
MSIRGEKVKLRNRQSTMQIKPLAYFASTFVVTLGATIQDVLNDISILRSRLDTLDNDLNNFSGGIVGALVSLINNDEKYVLKLGDC